MHAQTSMRDYIDSTPLLGDAEALRERANEEGYLFFRNLLPPEEILALRQDMLGVVQQFGWRQPGLNVLDDSIEIEALNTVPAEKMRLDIGVSEAAYCAVQKLESLHRLPHHPQLLNLYRQIFGTEVLVHARHIARMVTPHYAMVPTPQHQDFPLIQGSPQTWTCWFPLGDCPRSHGGLTVLRGSHRAGYIPIQPADGAGGMAVQLCRGEDEWVSGDFKLGDVLTFPSYTVHRALPSSNRGVIRLSLDVRYQSIDEGIESGSLLPHCNLTWDEIYSGWKQEDLKRYWEKLDLQLVPYEASFAQPSRRIC